MHDFIILLLIDLLFSDWSKLACKNSGEGKFEGHPYLCMKSWYPCSGACLLFKYVLGWSVVVTLYSVAEFALFVLAKSRGVGGVFP